MGTIATNKELINTDSITSIEVCPERLNLYYRWKEASYFLYIPLLLWRKAGFYGIMGDYRNLDYFEENHNYYVKNKWVYYKPFIDINLNDRTNRRIYFKTVEDMKEYITQFKNKNINFFYL